MKFSYTLLENPTYDDIMGLRDAYEAALMSDDPSTQVGASLARHQACNSKADYRDLRPGDKNWSRVHAEVSVLLRAASQGTQTRAHTLYAPWACCTGCASAIIKAGVPRVVVHHEIMQRTPDRWLEEVDLGVDMLVRNNVRVEAISKVLGVKIRFNGEEITL